MLVIVWFVWLRRLRLESLGAGGAVVVEQVADGLSFATGELRVELPWSAFEGFVETPRLFVLRQPQDIIRPIPKSAFETEADRERFGRLLRENLPSPAGGAAP